MSNSILQIVKRSACLNFVCLALTFSCAAAERPNFSGTWTLNRFERDGIQQSADQVISNGQRFHGAANDQSRTARDPQYSNVLRMLEGLWAPPEQLVIRLEDPIFAVSDGEHGPLTLHTDGRADLLPDGIEIITRWVDATLVTATKTAQSSTITTYVMARGGYQMLVSIEANIPEEGGPVITRYLYNYSSPSRVFSSFWQLHPPITHKRPISIDAWTRSSESLANDIDKEIAKSQVADRHVLDFLQLLINNDPKPFSTATLGFVDDTPEPQSVYRFNPLHAFDSDLRALTGRVSSAVVEVIVDRYGPGDSDSSEQATFVDEQKSVASGVIVDPSGYILTNAHVVSGAWQVRVLLAKPQKYSESPFGAAEEPVPAAVLGSSDYFDLALLKIDATNLPSLSFAKLSDIGQGQIVVAVGSPLGLDTSVSMGIISSIARQANPNSPLVYLQTDAPINVGNSGGALVDVNGKLVGINTSIFTHSGGSEGVGFALPAPTVKMVYDSLREKGYIGRRGIGVATQPVTSVLAKSLNLHLARGLVACRGEFVSTRLGEKIRPK